MDRDARSQYKEEVELRDQFEEERRLQVKKDHYDHVQRLVKAMQQRDERQAVQVKELASRKVATARKREEYRKARDAKHASAWVELNAKQDYKEVCGTRSPTRCQHPLILLSSTPAGPSARRLH